MQPLIPYFEVLKFPITDDFAIHGFGILVALGFVVGSHQAARKAARDGLEPDIINRLVSWVVAGVFIGGHWGHLLFYYPEQIAEDPMSLLRFWQGLSSFGGFIGCAILGVFFVNRERNRVKRENRKAKKAGGVLQPPVHIWGYADSGLFGFALGWAFGRTGCFVAHDHPGVETNFWLGVKGMMNPNQFDAREKAAWIAEHVDAFPRLEDLAVTDRIPPEVWQNVAYHDMGLYEVIWSASLFLLFLVLDRKPRAPGFFVGLTFAAYGPVRLAMDAFRHISTDTRYFGLTPAQYGSIAMTALGAWILFSKRNETPVKLQMAAFRQENPPVATEGRGADLPEPADGQPDA
jgi:phosphatidylglycerol:prolipoprotein diacylglycerol transferase